MSVKTLADMNNLVWMPSYFIQPMDGIDEASPLLEMLERMKRIKQQDEQKDEFVLCRNTIYAFLQSCSPFIHKLSSSSRVPWRWFQAELALSGSDQYDEKQLRMLCQAAFAMPSSSMIAVENVRRNYTFADG